MKTDSSKGNNDNLGSGERYREGLDGYLRGNLQCKPNIRVQGQHHQEQNDRVESPWRWNVLNELQTDQDDVFVLLALVFQCFMSLSIFNTFAE